MIGVDVNLHVSGFVEIDGVKLKVVFIRNEDLVIQWIISCIFVGIFGIQGLRVGRGYR